MTPDGQFDPDPYDRDRERMGQWVRRQLNTARAHGAEPLEDVVAVLSAEVAVLREQTASRSCERTRIAELIRAHIGREHCTACRLRWAAGNRRLCRRCRTSHALSYAIETNTVAEHMLQHGGVA